MMKVWNIHALIKIGTYHKKFNFKVSSNSITNQCWEKQVIIVKSNGGIDYW